MKGSPGGAGYSKRGNGANFRRAYLIALVGAEVLPVTVAKKLRRRSRHREAVFANEMEEIDGSGSHFQHPGASMTHHLARQMEEAPAYGGYLVTLPAFGEGGMFEQNEQVVGDDTDAKKDGIG